MYLKRNQIQLSIKLLIFIFKDEIRESLQLKDVLCKYDEQYQNNLALFRTKGLKLRRMRKIIQDDVLNQPLCTGIFDSKQHILRQCGVATICQFAIKLHWEPESKIPFILDDRKVYLPVQGGEEVVGKKDEVEKVPWEEYKKKCKVEQITKVIIIDCKAEYIKID